MEHVCASARRLGQSWNRRDFLRVGCTGVLGLTLADVLGLQQAGAATRDDYACIVLWLTGGPSQFDTFDPKPDAPAEVRGPFQPIATNVSGIRICELFPRLAKHAEKYALLRSVHHSLDDHTLGMGWMLAGRRHDTVKYPPMGSVVARLKPQDPHIPSFVTLPRLNLIAGVSEVDHSQTAGDLGPAWNPLIPNGVPGTPEFAVPDLALPPGVTKARFESRIRLLAELDQADGGDPAGSPRRGLQAVYERAATVIRSDHVRQAFDLEREPAALRDEYGRHGFGQSTLLARRLVEAGVRFVTVNWPNYYQWDHHGSIEKGMRSLAPVLDSALAALLQDLHQRGLLSRTLVLCMGEFGRTPRLNRDAGRDHWVQCMSVLMAGARIRGGQVIGSTTADGYPDERPVHARDMVATAYRALSIDTDAELRLVDGRPITVLPGAQPVAELL